MNLGEQFKAGKRKFIFTQQEVEVRNLLLEEAEERQLTAGSKKDQKTSEATGPSAETEGSRQGHL